MSLAVFRKALPLLALGSITGASTLFGQTPPPGRVMMGRAPELPEAKSIAQPKNEGELAAAIKKLAGQLAASGKFSGSILVAADGKVLVDEGWGQADRDAKVPNKPDTAFDVGSIGKLFTQLAILQLADAGKLNLDDTFGKYLTNYPNHEIASKVTIRQLLLNTSGMTDVFDRITPDINLKSMRQLKDFLPLFAEKPLDSAPGAAMRYSSAGYIVLGLVIEAVAGEDYYSYVKKKILEPAGMTDSGFFDRTHLPATVAHSYDEGADVTNMHPPRGSSAGGLQASAGDLLRLVQSIDAGKLINKESIKALRGLIPTPPNAPPPRDASRLEAYGVSGGAPGVSALLSIDPSGRYTRIILCNNSPPMAMAIGSAMREWIQQLPK